MRTRFHDAMFKTELALSAREERAPWVFVHDDLAVSSELTEWNQHDFSMPSVIYVLTNY